MSVIIELKSVVKNYILGKTIVRAVQEVCLQIHEREFIAIAGPSGSGKTTLLNLMGCLDDPTSGQIVIGDTNVVGRPANELNEIRANHIGFIFQSFNLIPVLTAIENVEYPLLLVKRDCNGRHARRKKALSLLAAVQLVDVADRFPNELSGGQMQRVSIARALVTGPSIVLADEPTANLDSQTGALIIDLMRRINLENGTTFVFSTHDPKVMQFADRIVEIRDGKVVNIRRNM